MESVSGTENSQSKTYTYDKVGRLTNATIGRFAQADPIPGGNANDYAYAVDPVNSHDFSGRFLQGGSGNPVHIANGTHWYQPAAPAPYFQPAVSMRVVQTIRKVNLPIVRPAAPKRNDTGRLPVASVNAVTLLTNAASSWQASTFVAGDGRFHAHITVSGGGSMQIGRFNPTFLGGVKFSPDGIKFVHFEGASLKPGLDWSATMSSSPLPDAGCSPEVSGFYGPALIGLGGSYSPGGSPDIGVGRPGFQAGRSCVN